MLLEAEGLFDRVEVAPLDVLDERGLQRLLVVEVDDADRDALQPDLGRGPESTFAGDELILAVDAADDERLQDAVLADAGGQRRELIVVEMLARLIRVLDDLPDRDLARVDRRRRRVGASEKRIETSTQTWLFHRYVPSSECPREPGGR